MSSNVWDKGNWIGIRDSLGREIQVGDTIMYDPTVWGSSVNNRGVVSYDSEEACLVQSELLQNGRNLQPLSRSGMNDES